MACNRYYVVRLKSPCTRVMGGGFVQIVRASSLRTAEPAHVSCTEDAMVEQSQVREGLCEITSRSRSFASTHAPRVCKMGLSSRPPENATTRRKCCHPPVTSANIRACCRSRSDSAPEVSHKRMSKCDAWCRGGVACRDGCWS